MGEGVKHSDLALDTVYTDRDGRLLLILSLDRVTTRSWTHGPGAIVDALPSDKSFGVVALRGRVGNPQELREAAEEFHGARPTNLSYGRFAVVVVKPQQVKCTWEEQLTADIAKREADTAAWRAAAVRRAERDLRLARLRALLPAGTYLRANYGDSDEVVVRMTDLLAFLESRDA